MNRSIIILCFIFVTVAGAGAQSIQVNARLDTTVILIGDQINLRVELEKKNGVSVRFPVWDNSWSPHIEVMDVSEIDSVRVSRETVRFTQNVLVTSFDSGRHELPPVLFPFTDNGQADTIATMPMFLEVLTMPVDTLQQIADIKPIYRLPIGWEDVRRWLLAVAVLAALVVLGFAVYARARRKHHQPFFRTPKPVEPPHVIALRELDRLRGEKLWQNSRVKEYYTRLSDIVRAYIEGRFEINAMEMTSDEILAGLKASDFEDNNLIDRLQRFFSLSDLVKFAKMNPLPDENETSLLDGYLFVNRTKIDTPPKTEEPDAAPDAAKQQRLKIRGVAGKSPSDILNEVNSGARFVRYSYCVSLIAFTFKLSSPVYFLRANEAPIRRGWIFLLISAIFGWWGIPWGPVYTIQSILHAFKGRDLTGTVIHRINTAPDAAVREMYVDTSDDFKHKKKQ
ncbi:MAG: hypothetical protein LBR08_00325 [Bacteroidales bacterium]|jgi:hypothetical protein|nr:hypothetical protein [Bacteroidales bacterium]